MRIMWLSPNFPVLYNVADRNLYNSAHYFGSGWIDSLETLLTEDKDIELGILFLIEQKLPVKKYKNITYYPIFTPTQNKIKKFISNWSSSLPSNNYWPSIIKAINEFKPELIQVFGTEQYLGNVIKYTDIPVVFHLQGILNPYLNAFFPPGINNSNLLFHTFYLKKHLLGNSLPFDRRRLKKQAKREIEYFKNSLYFMGRTHWDKSITELLAPQAKYFHVDEVLRTPFYNSVKWKYTPKNKIILISTLSDTIYKGLDVIIKTALLLNKFTSLNFEWQVIGIKPDGIFKKIFEKAYNIKFEKLNISFPGVLQSEKLIEKLLLADLYIHPSYIDNSPNSICEAQMLGMPTIACNTGGISTLIDDKVTGILIPANAPYEMALQIKNLTSSPSSLEQMGERAYVAATKRHNKNKIITELKECYKSIITQVSK